MLSGRAIYRLYRACTVFAQSSDICSSSPVLLYNTRRSLSSKMKEPVEGIANVVGTTNRLKNEKSPYLLQHATNPVDWWPWCEEAFAAARAEDKLIFLSVGYSTCHWCHVMERESFSDSSIASIMNNHFIPIKVDREERPDVDKIYMSFVQASSGSGGWPMSVFLTPDLKPVSGGTYYPPTDHYGRPGFKTVLLNMAQQWANQRAKVNATGNKIAELLRQTTVFEVNLAKELIGSEVPDQRVWELCLSQFRLKYEPEYGGWAPMVKFPTPSNFTFLFHLCMRDPRSDGGIMAKQMALKTLDKMADGGIHDHIGQGFARYSTDPKWHVPHFEKMLYDQAQLAVTYSAGYRLTKHEKYAKVVRNILNYVNRDLSHEEGGFYSAEDADSYPEEGSSAKKEGAFYVWAKKEITSLLDQPLQSRPDLKLSDVFCHHYGVRDNGNVLPEQDPHDELKGMNVLTVFGTIEDTALKFELTVPQLENELEAARMILFEHRNKRPRPGLDNKFITSWNGLMISGFSIASTVLNDESYAHRAVSAVEFIKKYLIQKDGKLLRSCYTENNRIAQTDRPIEGFLDDYACLIAGLIDLYQATFNQEYIVLAEKLQKIQDEHFWDHGFAGYYSVSNEDRSLLFRIKEDVDGAEPSGNSVAAHNLIRLSFILDSAEMKNKATSLIASFTSRLERAPMALPQMVSALILHHDSPTQIVITGNITNPETAELIATARSKPVPGAIIVFATTSDNNFIATRNAAIAKMSDKFDKPAAYVCRGRVCSLPVSTPAELSELLCPS